VSCANGAVGVARGIDALDLPERFLSDRRTSPDFQWRCGVALSPLCWTFSLAHGQRGLRRSWVEGDTLDVRAYSCKFLFDSLVAAVKVVHATHDGFTFGNQPGNDE
jgi:hypothetical protein